MTTRNAIIGLVISLGLIVWSRIPSQPFAVSIITTVLGIFGLIISGDYLYGRVSGKKLSENKWFQTLFLVVGIPLVGWFIYILFTADWSYTWGLEYILILFIIVGITSLALMTRKTWSVWND